jgi:hypothetical protein
MQKMMGGQQRRKREATAEPAKAPAAGSAATPTAGGK